MNEAISLMVVYVIKWPVGWPLSRHNMLDGVLTASDALPSQSHRFISKTTQVIFNRFKHHSQATTAEAPIGQQRTNLLTNLCIVGPVTATACLAFEVILDEIAYSLSRGLLQHRNEFSNNLVVILCCGSNQHPTDHPALHNI